MPVFDIPSERAMLALGASWAARLGGAGNHTVTPATANTGDTVNTGTSAVNNTGTVNAANTVTDTGTDTVNTATDTVTPATVVFLCGDLGAGKTTLARGILRGLGHAGAVTSPTYTLVERYDAGARAVWHFDLYRIEDPAELETAGLRDCLDGDSLLLIEWPERAGDALPAPDYRVEIRYAGDGHCDSDARRVHVDRELPGPVAAPAHP